VSATPAGAHAFGQRYDLPLPLSHYLFGAAAAVVFSFLIVGLFVRRTPQVRAHSRVDLFDYPLGRFVAALGVPLKLTALALFAAMLLAGFLVIRILTATSHPRWSGSLPGSAWPMFRRSSEISGRSSTHGGLFSTRRR